MLKKGHSCYRPRRTGERKRKSVRGCIVDQNLSALALIVVRKGEKDIEGLTDVNVPRRLGPKRASHIRKLFALSKEDDVRKYVIKRPLPLKEGKKQRFQAPRIQRLVTPIVLQRKRHRLAVKKHRIESRKEAEAEYAKLLAQRRREEKLRRRTRTSSLRESKSSISSDKDSKKEVKKVETKKVEPPKPVATKKADDKKKSDDKKKPADKKVDSKKTETKAAPPAKKAEEKKKPEPAPVADKKKAPAPAKAEPAKRKEPSKPAAAKPDAKKPKKK